LLLLVMLNLYNHLF